ncbi:MAG: 6-phosphogluconolactonase [Anaerolineae bacterium]|nr:6-phosphogluconolactonase [Anaerolineae bacterium]
MAAEVRILPDAATLIDFAADWLAGTLRGALDQQARVTLVLSGGTTPRPLYARLARPALAAGIDWGRLHIFFADERCVPPDHPDSNYGLVQQALLQHVPIPADNVHRMAGELPPAAAAQDYRAQLSRLWGRPEAALFDVTLLGMGDDGHTASLFPGTAALHSDEWVTAHDVSKRGGWRLTLTAPALNATRQALFLVSGAGKADMLRQVLQGPWQPELYPAQLIQPAARPALWLVDAAAAARL